jgi:hypothetical protein
MDGGRSKGDAERRRKEEEERGAETMDEMEGKGEGEGGKITMVGSLQDYLENIITSRFLGGNLFFYYFISETDLEFILFLGSRHSDFFDFSFRRKFEVYFCPS